MPSYFTELSSTDLNIDPALGLCHLEAQFHLIASVVHQCVGIP